MKIKGIIFISILVIVLLVLAFPGHKMAREHVNYITATNDHPLNCVSCHLYLQKDNFVADLINADYLSPFNLTLSPDGKKLYVVAQEGDVLVVVDNLSSNILAKIPVGRRPHSVIVNKKGDRAYVSNQWADNIFIIDLGNYQVIDTIKTGNGPAEMTFSDDEQYLYVVNSFANEVSIFETDTKKERKRLEAGNNPTGIDISPSGDMVYVSSRRVIRRPYREPIKAEMTVIDNSRKRVVDRKMFHHAYIMENVTFTPEGNWAVATLIRPKNLIPSIQVEQGWMMTHGFGIIEQKGKGRIIQLLTDEPNSYSSDPFDVAITPDGEKAFISSSGVDMINVVDLKAVKKLISESTNEELEMYANHLGISNRYVQKRIPTGANPKGLAISPDGKHLYVAERLEDRIAVINTETLETEKHIDLEGPSRVTVMRKGRRLFNNAGATFQNQYSCYTCHPDAAEDGVVYNMAGVGMGRNITNTQTLRDIGDIPPYKWNGHNQSVYKQDGYRFSTFLTRTEPYSYDELDALTAYIMTGIHNPPNLRYNPTGELNEAQKRGEKIFFRTTDNFGNEIKPKDRCYVCHPPPDFTNKNFEDVGSLSATDDTILFDTPQLNNMFNAEPYLHDGRAETLEEIWTKYDHGDNHGITSDMTKDQLNDLVKYLKSLRDAKYYTKYYSEEYEDLLRELYDNNMYIKNN